MKSEKAVRPDSKAPDALPADNKLIICGSIAVVAIIIVGYLVYKAQ